MLNRRGILAALGSLVAAPVAAKFAPAVLDANKITFVIPNEIDPIRLVGGQSRAWAELFTSAGYSVMEFTDGDLLVTIDKDGVMEVS